MTRDPHVLATAKAGVEIAIGRISGRRDDASEALAQSPSRLMARGLFHAGGGGAGSRRLG